MMRILRFKRLLCLTIAIGLLSVSRLSVSPALAEWQDDAKACEDQLKAKQLDQAIQMCTKAIDGGAPSEEALAFTYNLRGISYALKGSDDLAIKDFGEVLSRKPNPGTFVNRGSVYLRKGDMDLAIQDFTQSIGQKPNPQAYMARGQAYARKGDANRAIADFEQAFSLGGEPAVKSLQNHLKTHGKYTGAVDGKYGPGTRKALEACLQDPNC